MWDKKGDFSLDATLQIEGETGLRKEVEPLVCTKQQEIVVGLKVKPEIDISNSDRIAAEVDDVLRSRLKQISKIGLKPMEMKVGYVDVDVDG